jgi:hypothetical protein
MFTICIRKENIKLTKYIHFTEYWVIHLHDFSEAVLTFAILCYMLKREIKKSNPLLLKRTTLRTVIVYACNVPVIYIVLQNITFLSFDLK